MGVALDQGKWPLQNFAHHQPLYVCIIRCMRKKVGRPSFPVIKCQASEPSGGTGSQGKIHHGCKYLRIHFWSEQVQYLSSRLYIPYWRPQKKCRLFLWTQWENWTINESQKPKTSTPGKMPHASLASTFFIEMLIFDGAEIRRTACSVWNPTASKMEYHPY